MNKHRNPYITPPRAYRGMTLIEVMIALTIGLILLAGTLTLFANNKRSYAEQDQMGRLQENARFALDMLTRDIRMAGYVGCSNDITQVNNTVNGQGNAANLIDMTNPVEGSEGGANWQPSSSTSFVASIISGDGITVRYLSPSNITIAENMPSVSAELKVTGVAGFFENEIAVLTDCQSADIFQITQVQNTGGDDKLQHNPGGANIPGNSTSSLSKSYDAGAQIMRFVARRYFIGDSDANSANADCDGDGVMDNADASPCPALFRTDLTQIDPATGNVSGNANGTGTSQAMVEGIESLEILYGVDSDGDREANSYVNAANVAGAGGWGNVVSVRFALLARTSGDFEQYGSVLNTNSYNLLSTVFASVGDRRRRRVFSTTVQVRNRSN